MKGHENIAFLFAVCLTSVFINPASMAPIPQATSDTVSGSDSDGPSDTNVDFVPTPDSETESGGDSYYDDQNYTTDVSEVTPIEEGVNISEPAGLPGTMIFPDSEERSGNIITDVLADLYDAAESIPILGGILAPLIGLLGQIVELLNGHNEDGSYTYGFEGADGSFKIETKLATGEVIGKYGYVDDSGKVRTVEYGANKYGFQPVGEGITIPPVTFGNDTDGTSNDSPAEDEGQTFVQVPIRAPKPAPAPKRKPPKQPQQQQFLVDQRIARPQIPQQPYFVREPEDVQIRPQQPQRSPTPSDINSLQLILGNELRDAPQFQLRANDVQPQRNFPVEESQEEPIPRPFPQSLTIPSVFDQQPQFAQQSQFAQQPQFAQAPAPAPIDFNQQFDIPSAPRVPPASAFRPSGRSQPKPKSRPPVLFITQPEDIQQPGAVRRNSNLTPESRSILDELLKQYAIPNASPAINDFSFSQNGQ